ncbi:MAG: hypothetical protein S4CHLAM81_08500 [Chlamydiales bacterium]|nr:hypothetical protein [Chlamydiales bacterium]MCH9635632.1 hypothetical protein [Chlamydiales bacterium]
MNIFQLLTSLDEFFWGYIAFILIAAIGLYFSCRFRFFQITQLPQIFKNFLHFLTKKESSERGVHPLKAFFASTGGMIGIGNVVGVTTAIQIGGPGALLWLWLAGMIGSVVKYCEIYLGIKHRVENNRQSYDGGPMYFLKRAFKSPLIPLVVCGLLCIYGVEIYQFSVITQSVSTNWHVPTLACLILLLGAVLWAAKGGIKRVGQICSLVVPFFILLYIGMGLYVIVSQLPHLPAVLADVVRSAFSGHAAIGGFAGATFILAIQQGIARAAYSADIGIGYDSIIQSESNNPDPIKQGRLAILGVFIDNLICTMSVLIVLLSGVWTTLGSSVEGSTLMQAALSKYFPGMHIFLPLFYIITGYTTIISYLCIGMKCARYLAPKFGERIYLLYGAVAFIFFSFMPQGKALLIMSICGAALLILNLLGIFRLRDEILYEESELALQESK